MLFRKSKSSSSVTPPDPPQATRLNKLAVILAAAIMSATLLVVTFMVSSSSEEEARERETQETARRLPSGPARPAFLDRPPSEPEEEPNAYEESLRAYEEALAAGAQDPLASEVYDPSGALAPPPMYGGDPTYQSSTYGNQSGNSSPELQALTRAKRAGLTPQGLGGAAPDGAGRPDQSGTIYDVEALESEEAFLQSLARMQQPAASPQELTGPSAPHETTTPGEENRRFLQEAGATRLQSQRYLTTRIEYPQSPFELREGTIVEAFLLTGIHSDLPGDVAAQISRNVYDSQTQQTLLIPRGSRLIGTYNDQVALGQNRLLVAWTRLILPDGRSVRLPGLSAKDTRGATGLTGRVNRHTWRAFGNAMLLSVVGAGLALSQQRRRGGDGGGYSYPTPGEIAAGAVATELSRVATEMLRQGVNHRPTIRIPEGAVFTVFLNGDLALPPYTPQDGFMRPATR